MRKLDCEETQKLLDAFADNALDGLTSLAVQDHLDTCVYCRRHWQWNKELAASLSRLAEAAPSVDANLRASVLESPKKNLFEFWSVPRLRRRLAAAAIFIALLAGGAALLFRQQSSPPAAMDFVRNHSVLHEPDDKNSLTTGDLAKAQHWLTERLHGGLVIPKQAPDGFQLAGVRICRMGAAAVAQVIYEKDGQRLSFYLTEQSLASLSGLDHAERHVTSPVRTGECEGKHLAVWSQADRSYVLVGDVSSDDLLALANRLSAEL
jgi:anti-sigma factor RsiW